jgi:hypothetical protein
MARATHSLSIIQGETSQDIKRKERARDTHSLLTTKGGAG